MIGVPAAQGQVPERGRGGRAGDRDLPRQPSRCTAAGTGGGRQGNRGAAMIGRLKGIVDAIGESHCIIDVNGVGYEVQASARALRNMKLGEPVTLSIDTHVRRWHRRGQILIRLKRLKGGDGLAVRRCRSRATGRSACW